MKLSIITINYNNQDGLQKTIDSIVSQSFKDYEWIVIDGGSNDSSREVLERYCDHFTYWCSEPDRGIYNAINKGLEYATGEYIQFLNSGDWLYSKDVLEKAFSIIDGKNDIYYGDYVQVNEDNGLNPIALPEELGFYFSITTISAIRPHYFAVHF